MQQQRTSLIAQVLAELPALNCVLWPGKLNEDGYGDHRRVYRVVVGNVPDGMEPC